MRIKGAAINNVSSDFDAAGLLIRKVASFIKITK